MCATQPMAYVAPREAPPLAGRQATTHVTGVLTLEMQRRVLETTLPSITVEVDRSLIRDFAEAIGDPNPLWNDEAAARRSRYGGLIAPPTFCRVLGFIAGGSHTPHWELPGEVQVDGGTEWDLTEPLRPGDRITVTRRTKEVFERQGRSGPLVFIRTETELINQFGVQVCRQLSTAIRYTPRADDRSRNQLTERHSEPREKLPVQSPNAKIDWKSIEPGTTLPALSKCPSTRDLVRYAGAAKDYSEIHYDETFAKRVGLPGVIVHGALKAAYLGQLVTDWIGEAGTIKRLGCQHRAIDRPGELLVCGGRVTGLSRHGPNTVAECEIWLGSGSNNERSTPGHATVEFPGH